MPNVDLLYNGVKELKGFLLLIINKSETGGEGSIIVSLAYHLK